LAQVDTGVITGTVTDKSGGVLPRAGVLITNAGTGFSSAVQTNSDGIYVSTPLRPGQYQVTAELSGFQKTVAVVSLEINQRAVVNLEMAVGQISQQVTVAAEAPLLERETSALGNVRTEKAIKELPLNLRNVTKLFELTAGTVPLNTQSTGVNITTARGTAITSVNGIREQDNNVLIDGINNTENHNGTGVVVYPPLDALAEFKVQTSASDAQFGRAGGAVLNLTMKSGTRDFHGNAFEFLRNSALDAKNYFDPPGRPARFIMNQFGATLGGPLVIPGLYNKDRKKTFFFVDYEGIRRSQSTTIVSTVPLPAFVQGDFSASPFKIYDPLTLRPAASGTGYVQDQFPGNRIPANRIDPVGRNIANLYPAPTEAGLANNYVYTPVRTLTTNNADIKIDHYAGSSDWFTFRYSHGQTNVFEPPALPAPAVGAGPGFPGYFDQPDRQGMASYTHVFAPNKVNEFRAGVSRLNLTSRELNYGRNLAEELGVPGVNVPGDLLTSGGLSTIEVSGYRSLGDAGYLPAVVISENYQWDDNFSYIRGRHSAKFGTEIQRRRYNVFQAVSPRGDLNFGRVYTTNPASSAGTGEGVADLLLGAPQNSSIQIMNGTRGLRRSEFSFYAQDNFKISSRLTLNYGLRYDIYAKWPWTEVANRMAQFLPQNGGGVFVVGSAEVPQASGTKTNYNNFSPRIGLAYNVTSKTVLRGGYGIFYDAMPASINVSLASNPPFIGNLAYSNSQFDFTGARPASQGFDRPATFSSLGASLTGLPVDMIFPYVQQWNFNVERQLPGEVLLTVAYVGTKGTHLLYYPNINLPTPGPGAVAARRAFPAYSNINYFTPESNSIYNGLQITAEKRFSHGLSFLGAYTWSHAIDDNGGGWSGSVQNPANRNGDRASFDYDLRHRLIFSYNYELPIGRGKAILANAGAVENRILGGWQINGVTNIYSGFPFSPASAINTLNSPGSSQRADYIAGCDPVLPRSQRTPGRYFNVSCFATPAQFTFGNAGRNILNGPGTLQFDFSAFKKIPISETRYFQLRGEFFNILNTPQFNNPNASIGSTAAGAITSAGSPLTFSRTQRQIQVALKFFF
jgi:outer membrane receptor protein involved in Fe transport